MKVSDCPLSVDENLTIDPEIPPNVSVPGGIYDRREDEKECEEGDASQRAQEGFHLAFVTTRDTGRPAKVSGEAV